MANESTAVKKLEKEPNVLDRLNTAKGNIQARLPKGIDPDKFVLGIMTAIQKSKANAQPGKSLLDCDPNSVLLAAYDAAEVGCSLSPALQLGWLIPYGKEAQFQPSYRFFIQKAYETGEIKTFYAEVVYETDDFTRQFAPKRNLYHVPSDKGQRDRKNAMGAYALIEFQDGTIDWEYLTAEQIDRHRSHSKQPNSMKWTTFWEEGWRITPIRVLAKRLPLKNRSFEALVEMVNRDSERDLVIPTDEIMEPSAPKRLSEKTSTGNVSSIEEVKQEPKQETKQESKQEPKAQEAKAEPETKQAETKTEAPKNGSMFPEGEGDPFVTPADVSRIWQQAFAAGHKKAEVLALLKEHFKVDGPKDLRPTQIEKVLEMVSKPKS